MPQSIGLQRARHNWMTEKQQQINDTNHEPNTNSKPSHYEIFWHTMRGRFGSVQFSHWVVSDSLRLHGLQHVRPPCPSPTPGVHPNPCPLNWWGHPTISSSVIPFSSCLQSVLASRSFQMSKLFASGGQSIGISTSVLPMNIQDWFPLRLTGWISL